LDESSQRQDQTPLNRHDLPNEPTKDGPLLYVLLESPFAPVSTFTMGDPSLVFLCDTLATVLDKIMKVWSLDFVILLFSMALPVPDLGKDMTIPGQDRTFPAK